MEAEFQSGSHAPTIDLEGGTAANQGAVRETRFFSWCRLGTYIANTAAQRDGLALQIAPSLPRTAQRATLFFCAWLQLTVNDFEGSGNLEPLLLPPRRWRCLALKTGVIQAAEAGSDGGNSGGAVFTLHEGEATVIGIVTGGA